MAVKQRPKYPDLTVPIISFLKTYLYQSTLGCSLLTLVCYDGWIRYVRHVQLDYNWSDQFIFTVALSISHALVYVIINGIFSSDMPFIEQFKFVRSKGQVPSIQLINSTLIAAAVSQIITSPILTYYLYPYFISMGMKSVNAPLPSTQELAYTYFLAHCFNDVGFYWSHRALHTPLLYKSIHKQHHEYTGSLGIAAEYAHPIESVLSNMVPSLGGVLLPLGGCQHPLCVIVWLSLRLYQTYCAHSGLAMKGTFLESIGWSHWESACFHDHHHSVNKGNYGSVVTDFLFGTMDDYVSIGMGEGYLAKNGKQ